MIYENQDSGNCGIIHPHPFFREWDVATNEARCYLQMLAMPGGDLRQMYYWRQERVATPEAYEPMVPVDDLTPEQVKLLKGFREVDNIPRGVRMPVPF